MAEVRLRGSCALRTVKIMSAFGALGQRQIIFRRWIEIETAVANASNNSNNRQPFRIRLPRVAEGDSLSERVFVRPIFFCERVVNNHHARRVDIVRFSEETSAQQRRLQNSEIIRRDSAKSLRPVPARSYRLMRPSIANDESVFEPLSGRTIVKAAASTPGSCRTRRSASFQKLIIACTMVVVGASALRIFRVRKIHLRRQNVATIESGIDVLHPRITLEQKSGANQQHQRERDLRDHQRIADLIASRTGG